jgi:hypothetical protein
VNDTSPSALRPKVGTGVIVVHALGTGAVPADLEGSGFEVIVSTESNQALSAIGAGQADIALVSPSASACGASTRASPYC